MKDFKLGVRGQFHRAAKTYDGAARLQREACNQLLVFADAWAPIVPVARLLDAGCGTGYVIPSLVGRFPGAYCLALDFAQGMLREISHQNDLCYRVCGDIERIPLPNEAVDAIWSNLALQWCSPARAFSEIRRVLAPDGTAWVATLGSRTFHELREAFATVDDYKHVTDFPSVDSWWEDAQLAGLDVLECREQLVYAFGSSLRELLKDIKAIGANQIIGQRRVSVLGKQSWKTLEQHYEKYRLPDGLLPMTYDIVFIALRKTA